MASTICRFGIFIPVTYKIHMRYQFRQMVSCIYNRDRKINLNIRVHLNLKKDLKHNHSVAVITCEVRIINNFFMESNVR